MQVFGEGNANKIFYAARSRDITDLTLFYQVKFNQ